MLESGAGLSIACWNHILLRKTSSVLHIYITHKSVPAAPKSESCKSEIWRPTCRIFRYYLLTVCTFFLSALNTAYFLHNCHLKLGYTSHLYITNDPFKGGGKKNQCVNRWDGYSPSKSSCGVTIGRIIGFLKPSKSNLTAICFQSASAMNHAWKLKNSNNK